MNKSVGSYNSNYVKSKRMGMDEAKTYIDDTMDIINRYPKTTGGLLQARKAIDSQFRAFSTDRRMQGLLTPSSDEIKWRSARDSVNALLEMKHPGYKKELRRQHMLYKSLDVLEEKSEWEANTALGRFGQRHPSTPFIGQNQTTIVPAFTGKR